MQCKSKHFTATIDTLLCIEILKDYQLLDCIQLAIELSQLLCRESGTNRP